MRKLSFIWMLFFCAFVLNGQELYTFYFDQDASKPMANCVEKFENWKLQQNKTLIVERLKAFCDTLHSDAYNFVLAKNRNESIELILKENGFMFSEDYQAINIGEIFEADTILAMNRKVEVYFSLDVALEKKDAIEIENEEISDNPFLRKAQNPTLKPKAAYHHKPMNLQLFYEALNQAKNGDRIQIFDIHFYIDTPQIILKSEPYLNLIVAFMDENKDVSIKIEGHMCCNIGGDIKLSENRAKTIYRYLIQKGISRSRMSYEGFGVSKPIYEIPEQNGEEELKNRRVEIVVTKKNG